MSEGRRWRPAGVGGDECVRGVRGDEAGAGRHQRGQGRRLGARASESMGASLEEIDEAAADRAKEDEASENG